MAGLGTVNENGGTYLTTAGGFIWNRKAESSDPNYATQKFTRVDKTEGERSGAKYADLTGKVIGVMFKTHDEFGQNINVTVDADSEIYILSISTNNRYSQDMMKFLLIGDLSKEVFIKPYDFIGEDKKRAMGLSFRQGGEKVSLKFDGAPTKDSEWFKTAAKKDIRRFFEDLTDWFVAEVEEKVCSQFSAPKQKVSEVKTKEAPKEVETSAEKSTKQEEISPLKMKKFIKEYIAENYGDKEMPKLSKEQLVVWYNLAIEEEELPFDIDEDGEVASDDLEAQLDALLTKK